MSGVPSAILKLLGPIILMVWAIVIAIYTWTSGIGTTVLATALMIAAAAHVAMKVIEKNALSGSMSSMGYTLDVLFYATLATLTLAGTADAVAGDDGWLRMSAESPARIYLLYAIAVLWLQGQTWQEMGEKRRRVGTKACTFVGFIMILGALIRAVSGA